MTTESFNGRTVTAARPRLLITRLKLKNWRNFRSADITLGNNTYIIGPNASGKSNLLDALRFLRDIAKDPGGGLQQALLKRGDFSEIRCLHARRDNEVAIEIWATETGAADIEWHYELGLKRENSGNRRVLVSRERVTKNGVVLVSRPDLSDESDRARLTQTNLEQIQANAEFRSLADSLKDLDFIHLVPQLLKFSDQIAGNRLEDDPFGQGFLERIARETPRNRNARLKRIGTALSVAVPQFEELRYSQDPITGRPHLEAKYSHFRPGAGWQREDKFSDGTLRLIALLWSLQSGDSLLMLEEPELSLNDAIVREIPSLFRRVSRSRKRAPRQILVTTHSEALLSNPEIDADSVVLIEPAQEGSVVVARTDSERLALASGLTPAEVLLPRARPRALDQLPLWED